MNTLYTRKYDSQSSKLQGKECNVKDMAPQSDTAVTSTLSVFKSGMLSGSTLNQGTILTIELQVVAITCTSIPLTRHTIKVNLLKKN